MVSSRLQKLESISGQIKSTNSQEKRIAKKENITRKLNVLSFITLDSVMQAPGGPEEDPTGGFGFGGWIVGYWDDFLSGVMNDQMAKPFDLLLGRKTYEIFAAYWPYVKSNNPDYPMQASSTSLKNMSPQEH
jgi:hypothetical protein